LPTLLLNTTHVESGRRYVQSALRTESVLHDSPNIISLLKSDLPLATAIHNSARFTFVSPGGHLDLQDGLELGRVVDGGYFENSGLTTLQEINTYIRERNADTAKVKVRPIILYLCNDPAACARGRERDSIIVAKSTSVNELLAPVRALLKTRDARGALSMEQLRRRPDLSFLELDVCVSLSHSGPKQQQTPGTTGDTTRLAHARERVVTPALGWLLSKLARDWMDSSLVAGRGVAANSCRQNNVAQLRKLDSLLHPAAHQRAIISPARTASRPSPRAE
jgi:hypothetical protein